MMGPLCTCPPITLLPWAAILLLGVHEGLGPGIIANANYSPWASHFTSLDPGHSLSRQGIFISWD